MTRQTTKRRRNKQFLIFRRVRFILLIAALALCISLFTPLFHTKSVQVIGNEAIPTEQILEAAHIPLEENIFKLNKRAVRRQLLAIPEIEAVKIRRQLPSKVCLTVTETSPVMYFPYLTGWVVTNEKGRAMAVYDDISSLDLLYMTGLEIKNVEICEKISVQDTVKFDIIVNTIAAFSKKGLLGELRSCHFDNVADFHVYLKDGTKVIFGTLSDLDYKLSMLSAVMPQVHRSEGVYIDLSTPEKTVYGTITPEPEVSAEPSGEPGLESTELPADSQTSSEPANSGDSNENRDDINEGISERD